MFEDQPRLISFGYLIGHFVDVGMVFDLFLQHDFVIELPSMLFDISLVLLGNAVSPCQETLAPP